uniref:Uncharacterized protein n=2 Tax=Panagrolaimus sp. JU765 TaxID=591449 RepID=A0AC34QVF9_9BILA
MFGGYSIVFIFFAVLFIFISCAIFVFRQIQRIRLNSARREINSSIAPNLSKKNRQRILNKIDAVGAYRISDHVPKFTEITTIVEHANASYLFRMIGFDEIFRFVDRQLEVINPHLVRLPGESTNMFLQDVREVGNLPIDNEFIARLCFLHEVCRFRTKIPFLEADLEELRSMLREFTKILNNHQAKLSAAEPTSRIARWRAIQTQSVANPRKPILRRLNKSSSRKQAEEIPLLQVRTDPRKRRKAQPQL